MKAVSSLRRAALVGSYSFAALALLSFAAPLWWPLDLVASLRIQLAVALSVVSVSALVRRNRTLAIVCLIAFAASAIDVARNWIATMPGGAVSHGLTVVVANLDASEQAQEELGKLLTTVDADLVFIAESPGWRGALPDAIPALGFAVEGSADGEGLVLLSRQPIETPRSAYIGRFGRSAVVATVPSGFGPLHLVLVHAPAPTSRATYFFQRRYFQRIANLPELSAGSVVVVGDFSSVPWSTAMSAFVRETGLRLTSPIATWPARLGLLGLPIDYVLASPHICVSSLTPVRLIGTDHAALIAKVGACAVEASLHSKRR